MTVIVIHLTGLLGIWEEGHDMSHIQKADTNLGLI